MTKPSSFSHPPPESGREVLRKHGKTFHFAGRFLSAGVLEDCAVLYRFCRYLDDLVDDASNKPVAIAGIQSVRRMLEGGPGEVPPGMREFSRLMKKHNLSREVIGHLLDGLEADTGEVRFEDWGALHRYCYQVAGTVGLLMAQIMGVTHRRAFAHAVDLGIAMQLTNIARDVGEDAERGRLYLPLDQIPGVSLAHIRQADETTVNLIGVTLRQLLGEAEKYYRSGEAGLCFLPPRSRFAILMAARLYRAIGSEIRKKGYRYDTGRVFVRTSGKARLMFLTTVEFFKDSRKEAFPRAHQASLHDNLDSFSFNRRRLPS